MSRGGHFRALRRMEGGEELDMVTVEEETFGDTRHVVGAFRRHHHHPRMLELIVIGDCLLDAYVEKHISVRTRLFAIARLHRRLNIREI